MPGVIKAGDDNHCIRHINIPETTLAGHWHPTGKTRGISIGRHEAPTKQYPVGHAVSGAQRIQSGRER
jgi:hypothetical protein